MRASAVKTAIANAIEAITPDSNAGNESFVHIDLGGRDPGAITERAFVVELTAVHRSQLITLDCQAVDFAITTFFHSYEGVETRLAEDAEQIIKALTRLHEQNDDLYSVEFDAVDVAPSRSMDGMLEASLDVSVTYRRTGV